MRRYFFIATISAIVLTMTSGCLPTQTIIVKFEDLKSDMAALESSLETADWAKFDWEHMTIHISSNDQLSPKPVALGSFQISQAASSSPGTGTSPGAVADQPKLDLKTIEVTDTVAQLMRRRQARFSVVNALKQQGVVGESNVGMLLSPKDGSLSSCKEDDRKVAEDENSDRRMLLMELLRQRHLGADRFDDIARTFAQVQRDKASRGVWVQFDNGVWDQIK